MIAATKESAKIFARDTSELLPCIELNVIELGSFRYALGYLRRIRASQGLSSPCDGGTLNRVEGLFRREVGAPARVAVADAATAVGCGRAEAPAVRPVNPSLLLGEHLGTDDG